MNREILNLKCNKKDLVPFNTNQPIREDSWYHTTIMNIKNPNPKYKYLWREKESWNASKQERERKWGCATHFFEALEKGKREKIQTHGVPFLLKKVKREDNNNK